MCSTGSSCGQQGVIFNILYHRHQELLECHTFVTNHALFNASRSTLIFLAQWRLVLLWKCCFIICYIIIYYCHYYHDNGSHLLSHCTTRYMNYFTCVVKLTWNYRKLCNKCPGGKSSEKCSYSDFSCTISGFTSNSRAPGGPVTYLSN